MRMGRAREMGLGAEHAVTLAEARHKAVECHRLLDQGIDPILARKERVLQQLAAADVPTFAECAADYIKSHRAGWKNTKHADQWQNTLQTYAYPFIGECPIDQITTDLVHKVLGAIWYSKTETASRLRGRIEAILAYATVRKLRTGENPARWRGHLDQLLPKQSDLRARKHHAALPYREVAKFVARIRKQEGTPALALLFAIATACRTNEVIGGKLAEVNLSDKTWVNPGGRMKARRTHSVPLSPMALNALQRAHRNSDYLFPGRADQQPLSNMAMLILLKRMGRSDLTVHGFRSTFRDWAAECTNFPSDVAEAALAHVVSNKTEAAYRRGDLFEKRRELMNAWSDYCTAESTHSGKVTPIGKARIATTKY